MNISELLGLDDERLAQVAAARWQGWQDTEPRLAGVPDPARLTSWRWTVSRPDANEVLLGLARLAAVDGGDDSDAATVLAWLVLPGVLTVRRQLRQLVPSLDWDQDLDQRVAAQFWQEVRTLPWRQRVWVASRVCWRIHDALVKNSVDDTAVQPSRFADVAELQDRRSPLVGEPSAAEQLADLLAWARHEQLISEDDRLLLLSLVAAARALEEAGAAVKSAALGGLSSVRVSEEVASWWGLSGRAVRRRTRRCLGVLSAAAPRFFDEVAA